MNRAGEAVRIAQGKLIVRCPGPEHVDIGVELVDEDLESVGRVVDVFGPAERPYLAVLPDDGVEPAALLGAKLYAR